LYRIWSRSLGGTKKTDHLVSVHVGVIQRKQVTDIKTILTPIWTYGLPLWGTASNSNIEILQRNQNKVTSPSHKMLFSFDIIQRMNVTRSLLDGIKTKQLQWYGHVQRMEEGRLPK
jgi:vesicle coat complex subunit